MRASTNRSWTNRNNADGDSSHELGRLGLRLALTAPRVVDAGLGVAATLFAIGLTWFFNASQKIEETTG